MISIKWLTFYIIIHFFFCSCDISFYHEHKDTHSNNFAPEPTYNQLNLADAKHFFDRKNCGKSLKHLGGLLLDKSDKESKLIVEGSVVSNKLIFKIGNVREKEMSINNIILPIETISKKCINIRQIKIEDSAVLCLSSTVMRNFWINSITDAVLCNLTKVSGKLPEFNYLSEEDEKEDEKEEEKAEEEQQQDEEQEKRKKKEAEVEKEVETETKRQRDNVNGSDNEKKYEKDKEKKMEKKEEQKEQELKDQEKEKVEEKKKDARTKEEKFETPLKTTKETQPIDEREKKIKDEKEEEKIKKKILREEFDDDVGREEKEKGLKLRIAKSKYGYAKVKINGKSIDDIKKDEELERTLKNEEKEMAERVVEDINEMDEIDDF